jgi:hypothetical protein
LAVAVQQYPVRKKMLEEHRNMTISTGVKSHAAPWDASMLEWKVSLSTFREPHFLQQCHVAWKWEIVSLCEISS